MMKKTIITLTILALLLMCMTACTSIDIGGDTGISSSNGGGLNVTNKPTIYDTLEEMVNKDYSKIEIDVVTTTTFAELNSSYILTQDNVAYTVEKLNLLPSDGSVTDLPSNYKTKVTGYALIQNGQIVEFDGGNDVTIPSYNELKGNFNFDEDNFKNVIVKNDSFKADVVSPAHFYGANVNISNLKVEVEHDGTQIRQITIFYILSNAIVETQYKFTK